MKKPEKYLKLAMLVVSCLGVGRLLYQCMDRWLRPMVYAAQSAPWYLGCIVILVVHGLLTGITAILYLIVRQRNRRRAQKQ